MKAINCDMNAVSHRMHLTVRLRGQRRFAVRWWCATQVMRVAMAAVSLITGCSVEVNATTE
jgi:hypothetical protein